MESWNLLENLQTKPTSLELHYQGVLALCISTECHNNDGELSLKGLSHQILWVLFGLHMDWSGRDGFTNRGRGSWRFSIYFSENRWQGVNSSRRWIYKSSILLEPCFQIWRIFSHLLAVLSENYGPISKFVNPSGIFQGSPRIFEWNAS